MDLDQTSPLEAFCAGFIRFAKMSLSTVLTALLFGGAKPFEGIMRNISVKLF